VIRPQTPNRMWMGVSVLVGFLVFRPLSDWLHAAFGILPWESRLGAVALIVCVAAAVQTIRMQRRIT
jgi:hypothetical protein